MKTFRTVSAIILTIVLAAGTVAAQEESKKNTGRRKGAKGGAIVGLTLGALTGDAKIAVAGAAAGAVAGGVSGDFYDYDQSRQDDRTQMLADGIAGSKAGSPQPGETVGETGKRHFQELSGEWKVDMWYMGNEGKGQTASGTARGLQAGDNAIRIVYQDIAVEGYEEKVGGYTLLSYEPGQGFSIENIFSVSDDVVKGVGEYLADRNLYNFYMVDPTAGEMLAGGLIRSNVRTEVRIVGSTMWIAEAFTMIDGEETKVQTYRFTRPQ